MNEKALSESENDVPKEPVPIEIEPTDEEVKAIDASRVISYTTVFTYPRKVSYERFKVSLARLGMLDAKSVFANVNQWEGSKANAGSIYFRATASLNGGDAIVGIMSVARGPYLSEAKVDRVAFSRDLPIRVTLILSN